VRTRASEGTGHWPRTIRETSPDQDVFPDPRIGGGGGGGSGFGEGAGWKDGAVVVVLVADGAVRAGPDFVVPWPDAGCERRCEAGSERGSDG